MKFETVEEWKAKGNSVNIVKPIVKKTKTKKKPQEVKNVSGVLRKQRQVS